MTETAFDRVRAAYGGRGGDVLLHGLGIGMALTHALRHDREKQAE